VKAEANGIVRANKFHVTCRGIGDGMYAMGLRATREVPPVIAIWINWQLARDGAAARSIAAGGADASYTLSPASITVLRGKLSAP